MYLFCISGLEGYYFIWSTINYPSEWWAETVYIGTIFYDLHKKKIRIVLKLSYLRTLYKSQREMKTIRKRGKKRVCGKRADSG